MKACFLADIQEIKNLLFIDRICNVKPLQQLDFLFVAKSLVVHAVTTRQRLEEDCQYTWTQCTQTELSFLSTCELECLICKEANLWLIIPLTLTTLRCKVGALGHFCFVL